MTTSPMKSAARNNSTPMWDVHDILAERTSVTGDDELLVVWKPSWVAVSNVKPGPVLRRYRSLRKWKFTSSACGMRTILPVEPETTVAVDHAVMREIVKASKAEHRNALNVASGNHAIGCGMMLGTVAKRGSKHHSATASKHSRKSTADDDTSTNSQK